MTQISSPFWCINSSKTLNLALQECPSERGRSSMITASREKSTFLELASSFARECFESIGGYVPIKEGAIDLVAVVTARMKGWTTKTFTDSFCIHHRPMGTARDRIVKALFKSGYGDYRMGVHPLWQLFRSALSNEQETPCSGRKPSLAWIFVRNAEARFPPGFGRICAIQTRRTNALVEGVF